MKIKVLLAWPHPKFVKLFNISVASITTFDQIGLGDEVIIHNIETIP
jgi:hypothetical protein